MKTKLALAFSIACFSLSVFAIGGTAPLPASSTGGQTKSAVGVVPMSSGDVAAIVTQGLTEGTIVAPGAYRSWTSYFVGQVKQMPYAYDAYYIGSDGAVWRDPYYSFPSMRGVYPVSYGIALGNGAVLLEHPGYNYCGVDVTQYQAVPTGYTAFSSVPTGWAIVPYSTYRPYDACS